MAVDPIDLGESIALQLEGIAAAEATMRCSIIWGGTEYPCCGGPEFGGKKVEAGGMRVSAKLRIKVRVEVFPDGIGIPQENQTLFYKRNFSAEPKKYRIDNVTNFFGAFLQLDCEDPNQGA